MDLYLMQHGEALPADVDPERPLSTTGRRNAGIVAHRAAACGVRIEQVVHSVKLRAEQTALILAEGVGCEVVRRRPGLAPNDAVEPVVDWLAASGLGSLAVVGHLPHLEALAGLLVAGDPRMPVVAFRNAGLVHLVPRAGAARPSGPVRAPGAAGWSVAWVLTPELAS